MRILHVVGSLAPRYGGPSKVLPEMCVALARRGHEVEIFTTTRDGPSELPATESAPVVIDGVPVTYFRASRPREFATSWPMARALRRRVPHVDVVHIHSLYRFHTQVASLVARRSGTPYLIRPHGTLNEYHRSRRRLPKLLYHRLLEDRALAGAAGLHVTSQGERDEVDGLGLGAPTVLVPLGVEVPPPATPEGWDELRGRHPELEGRTIVTALGRISAKKGLDVLIDAFARSEAAANGAQLVIAGPDDDGLGPGLRAQAAAAGLDRRVTFTGMLLGGAKSALLERSRAFALPSRDENFGVAVVEAASVGVPVIVTREVGVHPEIERAGAGWVVDRTADAVAGALREAIAHPEDAQRRGEAGRRLAAETYSWDGIAQALERAYAAAARP